MKIVAKIFSSNWETYKQFYKRAVKLAYKDVGITISTQDIDYELEVIPGDTIQKQRHGSTKHSRTIRVYEDGVVRFVIGITNTNYDEDKRIEAENTSAKYVYGVPNFHSNTYLNQGINKILECYFECKEENADVRMYFYLLDHEQSYCSNLSNILTYRKLATIGFPVLNINEVDFSEWKDLGFYYSEGESIAYTSFNKFCNDMAYVASRNKGNVPAYVKCIESESNEADDAPLIDKYIYTFKGLGAEAYDCFLIMWTLIILAKREHKHLEFLFAPEKYGFRLGQEHPRFTQDIPMTITDLFRKIGIEVEYESTDEVLQQLEREQSQYEKAKSEGRLRNQELFRNNLRAKGIQTKCYLCGCEVESILQAAHLWGVAQIKKASPHKINQAVRDEAMIDVIDSDSKYANEMFYKRYMLANSGSNGVWLCSNHHGMFDAHHFVFNCETGKVLLTTDALGESYFKALTKNDTLPKEVLTPQTKAFLKYATME